MTFSPNIQNPTSVPSQGGANLPPFIPNAGRAPTSNDLNYPAGTRWQYVSGGSATIYEFNGFDWSIGGVEPATTSVYGSVILTDNSEPVATKAYADALAIAGAPVATETTSGIGKLVSDLNAVARIPSTGVQAYFITPTNLTAVLASPGPIGNTAAGTGTFTALTTDGTGAVSLGSSTAGDFTVATGDLTLESTLGSVVVIAGEAVDDAIQLTAAAGGLAATFAKSAVIQSTETNADSLQLLSGGGMVVTATGATAKDIVVTNTNGSMSFVAGEDVLDSMVFTNKGFQVLTTGAATQDITLSNTGGSITLVATENAARNIYLHANGGTSETVQLHADQGTGDASVQLLSDVGGITLTGGKAAATAINFTTSDAAGGITMTAGSAGILPTTTGAFTVVSTKNSAQAIELHANGGTSETIRIRADQGTAATSLDLLSDVGGITLNGGLASASAINITSSAAGGGWTLNSGTAGVTLTNTGALSLAAAAASNITVTGAFDLTLATTLGRAILQSGKAAADSVKLNASNAAGGITAVAGTGGVTLTNTGALSLAGSGASNITIATGDLSIIDTASSIILNAGEGVADAIQLTALAAGGGVTANTSTGGFVVTTTGAVSLDGVTASHLKVTGAADLTLQSTGGAVNVISGETNADSINVTSAGGMSFVATGASGKDILITNTNGSMTLDAGESATDSMNITASGTAGRVTLTAGTGSISLQSGMIVKVSAKSADYIATGSDYFIPVDTSGGVVTITLPAATAVSGRTYVIRDSGGAAAVNNITINGGGTNLVGGGAAAATKVLAAAYSGATVYSNGSTWNYAYVA